MPQTRVVHCKRAHYDIYIGRPSKWGNPFAAREGTLAPFRPVPGESAVDAYRRWILSADPTARNLRAALGELRGKVLGCWCAPKPCHGDVLADLADRLEG